MSTEYEKTEIENYGCIIPFVLNIGLLFYTGYKLFKISRTLESPKMEKLYSDCRTLIFVLIFLALIFRCGFQAHYIYGFYTQVDESTAGLDILGIIQKIPILLFISIASAFSNFWHQIYTSFEDFETMSSKHEKYGTSVLFFNIALYIIFIILVALSCAISANDVVVAIFAILFIGLVAGTLAILITGKKLHDKAVKLINYTGRTVKSTNGFRTIYFLLIAFCLIKCIQQALCIYCQIVYASDSVVTDIGGTNSYVFSVVYEIIVYALGESGFFLCLTIMLNVYARRTQTFLTSDTFAEKAKQDMSDIMSRSCDSIQQ